MTKNNNIPFKPATRLVNAGRDPQSQLGFVNPPVYHASTVLYPTAEDQVAHRARYQYGRRGTPTSEALEDALRALEGENCAGVALMPSGLAAISTALLAVAGSGDHILVTDSVYRPTRVFCDGLFKRMGVQTTYYDPLIGADIGKLFKPNTKAVFVEAPGSQSFEMQDIPAIAKVAHDKGALVLMDNTWATPLYFRAFEKGVDLSIQAGTKYIGGHSDIMFGCVSANAKPMIAAPSSDPPNVSTKIPGNSTTTINSTVGIQITSDSNNNTLYHNNLTNNLQQTEIEPQSSNRWDNGFQ